MAALVPEIHEAQLSALALEQGGTHHAHHALTHDAVTVTYHRDAFPDILTCCDAVLGMAGNRRRAGRWPGQARSPDDRQGAAVTYPFADAQMAVAGRVGSDHWQPTRDPRIADTGCGNCDRDD